MFLKRFGDFTTELLVKMCQSGQLESVACICMGESLKSVDRAACWLKSVGGEKVWVCRTKPSQWRK